MIQIKLEQINLESVHSDTLSIPFHKHLMLRRTDQGKEQPNGRSNKDGKEYILMPIQTKIQMLPAKTSNATNLHARKRKFDCQSSESMITAPILSYFFQKFHMNYCNIHIGTFSCNHNLSQQENCKEILHYIIEMVP